MDGGGSISVRHRVGYHTYARPIASSTVALLCVRCYSLTVLGCAETTARLVALLCNAWQWRGRAAHEPKQTLSLRESAQGAPGDQVANIVLFIVELSGAKLRTYVCEGALMEPCCPALGASLQGPAAPQGRNCPGVTPVMRLK
jgi:hypothetical protein